MRVIRSLREIPADLAGGVMTIGNFDGVHLAHQAIIRKVIGEARTANCKAIVMTFEPHPQQVLHPERKPFYLITTLEEKISVLESLGVDDAVVVPFTSEFSQTTAAEFAQRVICDAIHPVNVMIGHDYTFGRGKEGKPEYLRALGKTCGFGVEVIGAVEMEGGIVSSTRVRNAIQAGDVSLAARLLGRPYSLGGHVVEGDRRGRDIGFPTANIAPEKLLIPLRGVYAAFVDVNGERFRAAVNIGFNPTFTDQENLSIEAHLLDFKGHLYGRKLVLSFVERIRDEQKFKSLEALVSQIAKDVEQTRKILSRA
jgi:riboflavin kinase/FMN adenylyltransferase